MFRLLTLVRPPSWSKLEVILHLLCCTLLGVFFFFSLHSFRSPVSRGLILVYVYLFIYFLEKRLTDQVGTVSLTLRSKRGAGKKQLLLWDSVEAPMLLSSRWDTTASSSVAWTTRTGLAGWRRRSRSSSGEPQTASHHPWPTSSPVKQKQNQNSSAMLHDLRPLLQQCFFLFCFFYCVQESFPTGTTLQKGSAGTSCALTHQSETTPTLRIITLTMLSSASFVPPRVRSVETSFSTMVEFYSCIKNLIHFCFIC